MISSGRSARPSGALEQEVLIALAATSSAMTPGEVKEALGRELAYTTVMTTLSRLHAKGAITREMVGRGYAYRLFGTIDDVATAIDARRMRRILEASEDRVGILARFVADLTAEDEAILTKLLGNDVPRPPE